MPDHAGQNLPATIARTVAIRTQDDTDASRIAAVLEALGYDVVREFGDVASDRLAWQIGRVARQHHLTSREIQILTFAIKDGDSNETIARKLDLSRATIKWHMHNIFAKTVTGSREDLLRLVAQMPVARGVNNDAPMADRVPVSVDESERIALHDESVGARKRWF